MLTNEIKFGETSICFEVMNDHLILKMSPASSMVSAPIDQMIYLAHRLDIVGCDLEKHNPTQSQRRRIDIKTNNGVSSIRLPFAVRLERKKESDMISIVFPQKTSTFSFTAENAINLSTSLFDLMLIR